MINGYIYVSVTPLQVNKLTRPDITKVNAAISFNFS